MSDHRDQFIRVSRRRAIQLSGAGAAASIVGAGTGYRRRAHAQGAAGTPVAGTPADGANPSFTNPFGEAKLQGGTYIVALTGLGEGRPRWFVPTSYRGSIAFLWCKMIYTPLVTLDASWENLGPAIASSWEWSEDDLHLTMQLRDDVKFHDGQTLTAEDVVFTYKFMVRNDTFPAVRDVTVFESGAEYRDGSTDDFRGVEALDEFTVRFNLSAPSNVFMLNISDCGILPAHGFDERALEAGIVIEDLPFFTYENGPPIGTGPWRPAEYDPATHLTLEAHPDYYKGRPILDRVILRLGMGAPAAAAGIQAGELDGAFVGSDYQTAVELQDDSRFNLQIGYDLANEQNLLFATEKPYLDVKARQALLTAIDVQTLIDTVTFGFARPAPSVMMHPSLFPNPGLPEYGYDVERAKQLLAESSWEPGRALKFGDFVEQGTPDNVLVAIMSMWNEIGVTSEFTPLDPATSQDAARAEDHPYDVLLSSFAWLAYDPSSPYLSFACENRPNHSNYCNPEFDELMREAMRTLDADRATDLYQQAQVILQRDLPYAPVWIEPEIWATTTKMHGGVMGRGPLNDVLSELWWKES